MLSMILWSRRLRSWLRPRSARPKGCITCSPMPLTRILVNGIGEHVIHPFGLADLGRSHDRNLLDQRIIESIHYPLEVRRPDGAPAARLSASHRMQDPEIIRPLADLDLP